MRIAVTPGEPAGIGPEIVLQIAMQAFPVQLVAYADYDLLRARAELLNIPITLKHFDPNDDFSSHKPGELFVKHIPLKRIVSPGSPSPENASYLLKTLEEAGQACLDKKMQAVVTGPVNKEIICKAGIPFSGHTDFFAELTKTKKVVMMLMTQSLRVALATTHLPLRKVPDAITIESLSETLRILNHDLKKYFGLEKPHIAICGLNPHAGEGGYLGTEEIEIIQPVIDACRKEGMDLTNPLPADTAFLQKADAFLAMYHDQGLPVLKSHGFNQAINVTLGLPIIRTSVDHGTAFELAGTGKAKSDSLDLSVKTAIEMIRSTAILPTR